MLKESNKNTETLVIILLTITLDNCEIYVFLLRRRNTVGLKKNELTERKKLRFEALILIKPTLFINGGVIKIENYNCNSLSE